MNLTFFYQLLRWVSGEGIWFTMTDSEVLTNSTFLTFLLVAPLAVLCFSFLHEKWMYETHLLCLLDVSRNNLSFIIVWRAKAAFRWYFFTRGWAPKYLLNVFVSLATCSPRRLKNVLTRTENKREICINLSEMHFWFVFYMLCGCMHPWWYHFSIYSIMLSPELIKSYLKQQKHMYLQL